MKNVYTAGLYLRLSKDDVLGGESGSIENQRIILSRYADEHGWCIRECYIDDGWSGTNFRRPAFERMLLDAKAGLINLIITKDLSRIGRSYIEVGRLTEETLPALGVRFIALSDGVDSLQEINEIAVYRNIFNELASKEISRKARLGKQACMAYGKFIGTYAPLGYKRDPTNKYRFVLDWETVPLVRHIFNMRAGGQGYRSIAVALNEERIPSPRDLHYMRAGIKNPHIGNNLWNASTIKSILKNEVYIGHMVQGKSGTISYKDHSIKAKSKDDWIRVENTHEPLIDLDTWAVVRRLDDTIYYPRKTVDGERSMFVGLIKCGDCGSAMKLNSGTKHRTDGTTYHQPYFICGNYARSGKSACSIHSVSVLALIEIITQEIRQHLHRRPCSEQRVLDIISHKQAALIDAYSACWQREHNVAKSRLSQLDTILQKLFENHVDGTVPHNIFCSLMERYSHEHERKTAILQSLTDRINQVSHTAFAADDYLGVIQQYINLELLSQNILLALVDSIEVSEGERTGNYRKCHIHIRYKFSYQ